MPFTIEYVILREGAEPGVVDRVTSFAGQLAGAEQSARDGIERVRLMRPSAPPHGYQIRNNDGDIVLRSWEKAA